MITIKIRKWAPIAGLIHTGTSYQVSTNIGFTNIVDNNPNDTGNLIVYHSPVVIPVNTTYHIRVMRHFSNGTDSGWGDIIAVTNTKANGGVLTYKPIKVYQPVVSVDRVALNDPTVLTYTVSTSAFSADNEGHGYTTWMVLNDVGDVIEYVKSTTALTSIVFTKGSTKLTGTKYIRIVAIHGTLTNVESSPGEMIVDLSNVNFKLVATSEVHQVGVDVILDIVPSINMPNNIVTRVDLTDLNGTVIWTKGIIPTDTTLVIPGSLLMSNMQYLVAGYGSPADENHKYVLPLTVMRETLLDNFITGYGYNKTVTPEPNNIRYPKLGNLRSPTLYNGNTLTTVGSNLREVVRNTDRTFTMSNVNFMGFVIGTLAVNNIHLQVRPNGKLLMTNKVTAGSSRTYTYSADYYNNSRVLDSNIITYANTLSDNNALVYISDNVYYTANKQHSVIVEHTLGINSNIVNNIALPVGETTVELITKDVGNNLLVFCTGSNVIYSYNIDTKTYISKHTLPLEFRDRSLMQEELVNGDAIIWKPLRVETVNGTVVTDTVLDMLYIDNTNNTVTHIKPLIGRDFNIDGTVTMNDGKVLLLTDSTVGTNVLVFE